MHRCAGLLHHEEERTPLLCKPRLLALKPLTLEKIEMMQRDAQQLVLGQLSTSGTLPSMLFFYSYCEFILCFVYVLHIPFFNQDFIFLANYIFSTFIDNPFKEGPS